jgi:uncharacterized membrane protein
MNIIKSIVNIILFALYNVFLMALSGVVYWYIVTNVLWKSLPEDGSFIYVKIGILVIFVTFVITVLFRRFFYFSFTEKVKIEKSVVCEVDEEKPVKISCKIWDIKDEGKE